MSSSFPSRDQDCVLFGVGWVRSDDPDHFAIWVSWPTDVFVWIAANHDLREDIGQGLVVYFEIARSLILGDALFFQVVANQSNVKFKRQLDKRT